MNTLEITAQNDFLNNPGGIKQKGSALVIAVFVLALISVFVALALTRSAIEAAAVGNETAEGRTFYAAQGSLELMTRNFNKTFEVKINPSNTDLDTVRNAVVPRLDDDFDFKQEVDKTTDSVTVVLPGGEFAGLYAIRDNWRLRTTATDESGTQVQLTRNVLNNRIPIFQFGIFYDDDLELYRPPRFSFGGRVHSNRHFFLSPGADGVYFDSRVTAVGQIVTQTWRNGYTGDSGNDDTYIKNASNTWKQLLPTKGSVLNTTSSASDNIFAGNSDMPPSKLNTNWATDSAIFDGNLQSGVKELKLPLAVGVDTDLVEMVKRGKKVGDLHNKNGVVEAVTAATADNPIMTSERYANKPGIRVSLADSKAKLPGCATSTGAAVGGDCGIRLDGDWEGKGAEPDRTNSTLWKRSRGYLPLPMASGYQATRVNGERLYTGAGQNWIKVETVQYDVSTGSVINKDITQEILSLGVTEQAPEAIEIENYDETPPSSSLTETAAQPPSSGTDSRAIIKLQRFAIPGTQIPGAPNAYSAPNSASKYLYPYANYNFVVRYLGTSSDINNGCTSGCTNKINDDPNNPSNPNASWENMGHLKKADYNLLLKAALVPFPIQMFDIREGTYYDDPDNYTANRVTQNGVMSMVDIDVGNLRRFLRGDFDGLFPGNTPFANGNGANTLKKSHIPDNNGWVLYVSDRRGDYDFDGEYDMEDIYGAAPGNDGLKQPGEDLQRPGTYGHGTLNTDYINEATKYANEWYPDYAAVTEHKFYRRGVRLINGEKLPGIYDSANSGNTKGFTFASENGVYVKGNYNATHVTNKYSTGNTPYNEFMPFNSTSHIPASIVADSITILSNSWNDAKSFAYPYNLSQRKATETTVRFAMISGDTIANIEGTPNQGGISPRLNGGVHNFKRFLERWTDPGDANFKIYLNYSGSLINLFNSRNNNGAFKCCNTVYNPPVRNWVFDSTFLDASRLPPGTPFFQYVQITGFQRTND